VQGKKNKREKKEGESTIPLGLGLEAEKKERPPTARRFDGGSEREEKGDTRQSAKKEKNASFAGERKSKRLPSLREKKKRVSGPPTCVAKGDREKKKKKAMKDSWPCHQNMKRRRSGSFARTRLKKMKKRRNRFLVKRNKEKKRAPSPINRQPSLAP